MIAIKNIFSKLCVVSLILFYTLGANIATADSSKQAEEFISDTSNRVLNVIQTKISENKKSKKLEEIFIDVVDISWMGKFAVAKFWKNMSDDQKNEYLAAYKQYLIKIYVPKFKEYNNQVIKIISSKDIGNGQYQVMTQIITTKNTEKTTLNISYRCKEKDGKFQIRDIIGEDFSLLSTQRSEFAAAIEKSGIDKFITTLLSK